MVVVDRVGEAVAALGAIVGRLELEIDLESLTGFLLVRAGAVVAEHGQTFEANSGQTRSPML